MKWYKWVFFVTLTLCTGCLAGLFIAYSIGVMTSRAGGPFGGEVLFLPMMALLLLLGYSLGSQIGQERGFSKGYKKGCRHVHFSQNDTHF